MRGSGLALEAAGLEPLSHLVHRLLEHGQRQVHLVRHAAPGGGGVACVVAVCMCAVRREALCEVLLSCFFVVRGALAMRMTAGERKGKGDHLS